MTDDGFGVLAAQLLLHKNWPRRVAVRDAGTATFYFLDEISRSRQVIAIDTVRAGGIPGSVYRLGEADILHLPNSRRTVHGFTLLDVIELARKIGGYPTGLLIYGVEPCDLTLGKVLSPALQKKLPLIVE